MSIIMASLRCLETVIHCTSDLQSYILQISFDMSGLFEVTRTLFFVSLKSPPKDCVNSCLCGKATIELATTIEKIACFECLNVVGEPLGG